MPKANTKLKSERRRVPLTQAELAELVGVAEVTVRRWEAGLRPQPAHIRRLCSVFEASPAQLGFGLGDDAAPAASALDRLEGGSDALLFPAPALLEYLLTEGTREGSALEVATMADKVLTPHPSGGGQGASGSGP